jgi:DNA-binding NarL/FixJ family response regulator
LRVLRYLPTNLTRPEIAGQLSVSLNTINTHIRRIYTKLGATDRDSFVLRSLVFGEDDDEAEDHRAAVTPPRSRVDQERFAHEIG